jgi:hypothetical protein
MPCGTMCSSAPLMPGPAPQTLEPAAVPLTPLVPEPLPCPCRACWPVGAIVTLLVLTLFRRQGG